jgi:hypothetical protein
VLWAFVNSVLSDCPFVNSERFSLQEGAKMSSRQRGGYFEESQIYFDLFNTRFGYYTIPCVIS